MTSIYAVKLDLTIRKNNIEAQKIDGLLLKTHGMVSMIFSLRDNLERIRFFEETFLLADTSIEIVLRISFLFLSNVDIKFEKLGNLIWRSYNNIEALATISWVKLIDKGEFAKTAVDENTKNFVIHIIALKIRNTIPIYSSRTF